METSALRSRVQDHIRRHELIPSGGDVTVLVSGGADSTCAWHALRELGYQVSALHVNHGLRGRESDEDADLCRDLMNAEIVQAPTNGLAGQACTQLTNMGLKCPSARSAAPATGTARRKK